MQPPAARLLPLFGEGLAIVNRGAAAALAIALLCLLGACATTGDTTSPDLATPSPDMICTDNVAPDQCLDREAQSEHELLNRCSGPDVAVVLRDSRVPTALWDGRCALPPL